MCRKLFFGSLNRAGFNSHDKQPLQDSQAATTSTQPVSDGPTPYRYVSQGSGGTYKFTPDTLQHIGTSKCITCVGVYFAIDDKRCFMAHMNADTITQDGKPSRRTNQRLSAKIRDQMTDRLNAEQQKSGWGPVTERMRSSLVMVCPDMEWKWPMVGDAVSTAVQEWLGVREPQRPFKSGGFIIRHPGGPVKVLEMEASTRK